MTPVVGQKFKHFSGEQTYEVVAVGKTSVLVSYIACATANYAETAIELDILEKYYKEYKEPRKGSFFVNIHDNVVAYVYENKEMADLVGANSGRLACVEVHWTEGDGL